MVALSGRPIGVISAGVMAMVLPVLKARDILCILEEGMRTVMRLAGMQKRPLSRWEYVTPMVQSEVYSETD